MNKNLIPTINISPIIKNDFGSKNGLTEYKGLTKIHKFSSLIEDISKNASSSE